MKRLFLITLSLGALAFAQTPPGDLRGRVFDLATNKGVAGVTLVFQHTQNDWNQTVTTDDKGSFTMRNIDIGPVEVQASKEGYYSRKVEYIQESPRSQLNFRIATEGTTYESLGPEQPVASGKLLDTKGKGIPNAQIRVSSLEIPEWSTIIETDGKGNFEAPSIRYGEIQLYAKKEGYRDQIFQFVQPKGTYKVRKFVMQTMEEYFAATGDSGGGSKEKSPEDMAVDFYNQAVKPFQNKDYAQSLALAERALEMDPNLDAAVKLAVYSNHNLQNWEGSLKYAQQFLARNPEDTNMVQFAEEAARLAGKDDVAAGLQAKMKEMGLVKEDTPESLFDKAVAAINANDDATAKPILEQIIGDQADFFEAHRMLGMIYVREYEFDPALNHLKLYLKHAPADHKNRAEVTDLIVTLSE